MIEPFGKSVNIFRLLTILLFWQTLHKKRSFPLRISSVNVTKSGGSCGFGHIFCAVDVSVVITEDDE